VMVEGRPYPHLGVMSMALSAISDALETDIGDTVPETASTVPDWYRWFNPISKRWYAARTTPLANPRAGAVLVSAKTYGGLITAVVHSSPDSAGV
jgi:hypothetical protein